MRLRYFESDVIRARDLIGLGQALGKMTSNQVDTSEMYRSSIVLSVAAIDTYVHGVIVDRAVEIVTGDRQGGASDRKLGLSFKDVGKIVSSAPEDRPEQAKSLISDRLRLETYQTPDDIAKGLSYVGIEKVWKNSFRDSSNIIQRLRLAVGRRNTIAHQGDIDPTQPGVPQPISDDDAIYVAETVTMVVRGIDSYIRTV